MHSKSYVTVRYAETDKMGVVHHSNYPVWYEVGRSDYIKLFGLSYKDVEEAGILMPVINLNCSYKSPARYEDKLLIRTWAIELHAARIQFSYTIKKINEDSSETEVAYGTTEHGFIDSKTFKPVNMKKRMPQLYEKINATFL